MTTRSDVSFVVNGNIELGAWLFLPTNGRLPRPAITMAHGYAGVREHGIAKFANAFADAGFVVLLHDHRTFGASDGEPRQDVDPWGRSLIHALVLGATDRRIACVVSQVPTISGYQQGLRRIAPEGIAALEAALDDDERSQARGEPLRRQAVVSADTTLAASYRSNDAIDFYLQPLGGAPFLLLRR
jgi:uncharacterized protein